MPPKLGLVRVPPLWTVSAEHNAREVERRRARARAEAERNMPIVREHPKPWRRVDIDALPSAAASFARAAQRAGLEVAGRAAGPVVQVGIRERERNALWMRATWRRTPSGTWTTRKVVVAGVPTLVGTTKAKKLWTS